MLKLRVRCTKKRIVAISSKTKQDKLNKKGGKMKKKKKKKLEIILACLASTINVPAKNMQISI